MSGLSPRGDYTPRRVREQRAYRLMLAGGASGAVTVVGVVLAAIGIIGFGLPVVAAIVAIICFVMFRRTVGG